MGTTALMVAATRGEEEVASLLVDRGANVNCKDNVRVMVHFLCVLDIPSSPFPLLV